MSCFNSDMTQGDYRFSGLTSGRYCPINYSNYLEVQPVSKRVVANEYR